MNEMDEGSSLRSSKPSAAEPGAHEPCCSSHGVDMTCERYRRTHFVEVRPCCSADAALLAEEAALKDLDQLLGIDRTQPLAQHAARLVQAQQKLMDDLIAVRESSRLTTQEVGRRMGISAYAVRKLERADSDPCLSTLRRYALAIGAELEHNALASPTATSEASQEEAQP